MTKEEAWLREEVMKDMGVITLSKNAWENVHVQKIVREWRAGEIEEFSAIDQIHTKIKALSTQNGKQKPIAKHKPIAKGFQPPKSFVPSDDMHNCQDARQEFFTRQANALPQVVKFRHRLSRLLADASSAPDEEKWREPALLNRFLSCLPARLFSFDELEEHGLSPLLTDSLVVSESLTLNPFRYQALISFGGMEIWTEKHALETMLVLNSTMHSGEPLSGTLEGIPWVSDIRNPFAGLCLSSGTEKLFGFAGTVVGEALELCRELAQNYYLTAQEALLLLFQGEIPIEPLLHCEFGMRPIYTDDKSGSEEFRTLSAITLTIAPWIPVEAVGKYFRQCRAFLHGGDYQQVRNIDMFRFVNQEREKTARSEEVKDATKIGKPPTWAVLFNRWKEHRTAGEPERQLPSSSEPTWQNFRNAYHNAKDALIPIHLAKNKTGLEMLKKTRKNKAKRRKPSL